MFFGDAELPWLCKIIHTLRRHGGMAGFQTRPRLGTGQTRRERGSPEEDKEPAITPGYGTVIVVPVQVELLVSSPSATAFPLSAIAQT